MNAMHPEKCSFELGEQISRLAQHTTKRAPRAIAAAWAERSSAGHEALVVSKGAGTIPPMTHYGRGAFGLNPAY